MDSSKLKERVLNEINLIPEEKLAQLYDFIHQFRLGIEESSSNALAVLQFAGFWNDMSDEMFADFAQEIVTRRQQAFSGRRNAETNLRLEW